MVIQAESRLKELLERIARQPQIADLWQLHSALLVCQDNDRRSDDANPIIEWSLDATREFAGYLHQFQAKLSARQYNEWASRLDMGAVGTLAIQDLMTKSERTIKSYLLGGLSEALIVLASRQYIKAWDQEMRSTHYQAAWFLYEMLWKLSRQAQPDLPSNERQALMDNLINPLLEDDTPPTVRAALLTRLFQTVLIVLITSLDTDQ